MHYYISDFAKRLPIIEKANKPFSSGYASACELLDLLSSFGLEQHIHERTLLLWGTLDVVITSNNLLPQSISVDEVGISDHHLVSWSVDINRDAPTYTTTRKRIWKNFNIHKFKSDLLASELSTSCSADVPLDQMVSTHKCSHDQHHQCPWTL